MTENHTNQDWGQPSKEERAVNTVSVVNRENIGFYLSVARWLGVIALGSLIGILIQSWLGMEVSSGIIALGSAATGGLAGLFARQ